MTVSVQYRRNHPDEYPASQGTTANTMWLNSAELDTRINNILAILDDEERHAAYKELAEYCVEECLSVYAIQVMEIIGYQDYIYFPAAEYYKETGKLNNNFFGYALWFHDFKVYEH